MVCAGASPSDHMLTPFVLLACHSPAERHTPVLQNLAQVSMRFCIAAKQHERIFMMLLLSRLYLGVADLHVIKCLCSVVDPFAHLQYQMRYRES